MPAGFGTPTFVAEGGFGVVARCQVPVPETPGQKVAIAVKRVYIPDDPEDWEDTLRLLREIHFLRWLRHENVTPLEMLYANGGMLDDYRALKYIYLVMPYYHPGGLDE